MLPVAPQNFSVCLLIRRAITSKIQKQNLLTELFKDFSFNGIKKVAFCDKVCYHIRVKINWGVAKR